MVKSLLSEPMQIRGGFGLLEILIVVAIIALLMVYGGSRFGNILGREQSDVETGNDALERTRELQEQLDRQADGQQVQIDKIYEQARLAVPSGTRQ